MFKTNEAVLRKNHKLSYKTKHEKLSYVKRSYFFGIPEY